MTSTPQRALRPKPLRSAADYAMSAAHTTFYDLPAELRIEIYKLVLDKTTIHILPSRTASSRQHPHSLVRTSRQVRNEVLPIIHATCVMKASVTDFNFDGLLEWMKRMPPDQEANLCKNRRLTVELNTTVNDRKDQSSNSIRNSNSLRKWLHLRADPYRPQPRWEYTGGEPDSKTCYEMRRRAKRAAKVEEKRELVKMLDAIGVRLPSKERDT